MPHVHVVQGGEGISSIAALYGFAPDTLWSDPENAALRDLRKDGDILLPGDLVHVRDRAEKSADIATGKRHTFRRRGIPPRFQMQLFRDSRPRAGEPFQLYADGALVASGITDDEGTLRVHVPPLARAGRLLIGEDRQEIRLAFGGLNPISHPSGVEQRLRNLGMYRRPKGETDDAALALSLRAFQKFAGLPRTGRPDAATLARLTALHDRKSRLDAEKEGS